MLTVEILERQNKKLRERVDELEETLRQFREDRLDSDLPEGLPEMTVLEEKVLRALYSAKRVATREFVMEAVYGAESDVDMKILDVVVCRLRKRLVEPGHPKIVTVWGRGYAIDRGQLLSSPAPTALDVTQFMEGAA